MTAELELMKHSHSLIPLPLGTILPSGWLRRQLQIQADGLSGHLDEFWPSIADSKWIGGTSEGWERGPYWLDGLVPLAMLLDDPRLKAKVEHWVDYILTHQHEDGWLGAKDDPHEGSGLTRLDPWPIFVLLKALTQWQEATQDPRIIPAMECVLRRVDRLLDEQPLEDWAALRWFELAVTLKWLHARTGGDWLLGLWRKAQSQGYDWSAHFDDFAYTEKQTEWKLETHVVNHAMALKEPAFRLPPDPQGGETARRWIDTLDRYHGQATGIFTGDECLAGLSPTQGTETCAVVEALYSLELLLSAFGDPAFGDRLERIAFNALPAALTTDMWAHQYDQQANQVLCTDAPRPWTTNSSDSNVFGLEPNFGCCTANFHQGWPKLTASLWMQTEDGGLAAVAYGPCVVRTQVGGHRVTVTEDTDYPFRDTVTLTIETETAVRFPLSLRVPAWAQNATLAIGDDPALPLPAGRFFRLERLWNSGDRLTLTLPAAIDVERRHLGAVSIKRGPLVFALKIGEEFRYLRGVPPHADWEVLPTTAWNYGLALPALNPEDAFTLHTAPVGDQPFAPTAAPIFLTAPARRIEEWTLQENVAAPISALADAPQSPIEVVTLIPYGSTHLRITEFPAVAASQYWSELAD